MKKIKFILLAAVLGMLTSCGVGIYYPNAHNVFGAQTTVHLDKANFRVVRDVEAVVEVKNTNLSRSSVEKSAYGQLLRNARLTGSQVLINVVIEEVQRASGGLFRWALGAPKIAQYVAARATIIEFLDENGKPTVSEPYKHDIPAVSTSQPVSESTKTTTTKVTGQNGKSKTNFSSTKSKVGTTENTERKQTTAPSATAKTTTTTQTPASTISSKSTTTYSYKNKTQQLPLISSTHDAITRIHMGERVYRKYLTMYQEYIKNDVFVQEFPKIQDLVINYLQTHMPKELDKALSDAKTYNEILSVFIRFAK